MTQSGGAPGEGADAGDGHGDDPDPPATATDAPSPGERRSTDGGAPASAVSVARPTDPGTLAGVFLKGLFMGAADTVPGMSGGTVALVTGIYERLIAAITGFDLGDLRYLPRLHRAEGRAGMREMLVKVDAPFLVALGAGVLTAVATVAGVVETLLARHPGPLYAFFFGLIAASAVVLFREVDLDARRLGIGVTAAALVVALTGLTSGSTPRSLPILFVAAAVAASAMVLPGVSGSFLLLVAGQYQHFLGLVTGFLDAVPAAVGGDPGALAGPTTGVAVFGAGAVTGILTISHAVGWALSTHRRSTLAALVGLLVGGLALPVREIAATTPAAPGPLAAVVGAALVGAGALLAFDHYTDDLEY